MRGDGCRRDPDPREPGSAGTRIRGNPVIRQTRLLYALGAGCWTLGALIRAGVPAGQESIAAGVFFLCFPVCCITTYARRVPGRSLFGVFLLDAPGWTPISGTSRRSSAGTRIAS